MKIFDWDLLSTKLLSISIHTHHRFDSMDYLGNVVSILGSLFGIPLALIFPPLMHNALVKDSSTVTRWTNYAVVVVGVFAMAAASFNTIVTWNDGAEQG